MKHLFSRRPREVAANDGGEHFGFDFKFNIRNSRGPSWKNTSIALATLIAALYLAFKIIGRIFEVTQ